MIFTQYPESTLKEIVNPVSGMPSAFNFLPTIMEFGKYCADKASELETNKKRLEEFQRIERTKQLPSQKSSPCPSKAYTGPIENIKPGDIIPWNRMDEYREFMAKTHNVHNIKVWGFFEDWMDNGSRPFGKLPKNNSQEPNPFD